MGSDAKHPDSFAPVAKKGRSHLWSLVAEDVEGDAVRDPAFLLVSIRVAHVPGPV